MRCIVTAWNGSALCVLLCLAGAGAAEAQPVTFLSLDSQSGDFVGGGRRFTLTPADGTFAVSRNSEQGVHLAFVGSAGSFWHLDFAAPASAPLTPGIYEAATRFSSHPPTDPGLEVTGDGRACSVLSGRFVVLEAVYDGLGDVQQFAVDFEQHCDGARPALFGSFRLNSAVPVGPRLSVGGASAYESDLATTTFSLIVSLSAPAAHPVVVDYHSQDGTATAGSDYLLVQGTIVIPAGETAATVPVRVIGDGVSEGDETFSLVLENPQGAPLAFGTGVATIVNDDPDKTLLIFDSQPGETLADGAQWTSTPLDGLITATRAYDNTVLVAFTGNRSWSLRFAAPDDGLLVPGTYEGAARWPFQALGQPGLDVSGNGYGCNTLTGRFVVLEAVYLAGAVERLAVDYEQHCNGQAPALFGWVRYNTSAAPPASVFAEPGTATEGAGPVVFKIELSRASSSAVSVDYATVDGSAVGDVDYARSAGTLVIPAGAVEAQVTVPVVDDPLHEGTQVFELRLTGATGAPIGGATAAGTILDDDPAPVVSLGDVTVREGDPSRPGVARVPVSLDRPAGENITLIYTATPGSALAGQDFIAPSGSLVLGPGQTSATIDVQLVGDLAPEADETFTVTLTAVPGAQIGVAQATVTIEDDDGPTDYYTVPPCRLLDTRLSAPPIRAGTSLAFGVGGVCGVPASAKAVVLNVTAVDPTATGHFRIAPTGTGVPSTSVLNFVAGRTQAAGPVISVLGLNDAATLYCFMATAGRTHAVVDVFGYFE